MRSKAFIICIIIFFSLSHDSSEEIRPSFSLSLSPDESPDEVLFPMAEHPNTHQEEPSLTHHAVSFCVETDNGTSVELKEKRDTKRLNIFGQEGENPGGSDGRLKRQRPLSDPSEEATRGREDEGLLFQLSEYETVRSGEIQLPPGGFVTRQETSCDVCSPKPVRHLDEEEGEVQLMVDSENMTEEGAGQKSDGEDEMHKREKSKEKRQMYATLPSKTVSPGEMKGFLLLGTNEISPSQRSLDWASTTSNGNKSSHCYSEGAESVQGKDNDPECRLNTPEVKHVEHPPGTENKEVSVEYHTSGPQDIPVALERGKHKVNQTPPVLDQTWTETAGKCHAAEALVQGELTESIPGDTTTADNPCRPTEAGADVMEVGSEMETASGAEAGREDKMETEQSNCSHVQLRNRQHEADYREAAELPGRDAEPGERETDRDESVMPPVDSQGEGASTGNG